MLMLVSLSFLAICALIIEISRPYGMMLNHRYIGYLSPNNSLKAYLGLNKASFPSWVNTQILFDLM